MCIEVIVCYISVVFSRHSVQVVSAATTTITIKQLDVSEAVLKTSK